MGCKNLHSLLRPRSPCPSPAWWWWSGRRPGAHSHSCPSWRGQPSGCWTGHGWRGRGPRPPCSSAPLHPPSPRSAPCSPGLLMPKPGNTTQEGSVEPVEVEVKARLFIFLFQKPFLFEFSLHPNSNRSMQSSLEEVWVERPEGEEVQKVQSVLFGGR